MVVNAKKAASSKSGLWSVEFFLLCACGALFALSACLLRGTAFGNLCVQLLFTVPLVCLLETLRPEHAEMVGTWERVALVGYALIYLFGGFLCRA